MMTLLMRPVMIREAIWQHSRAGLKPPRYEDEAR